MSTFDVVVIGAGPAGYSAAIRAAQLGLSVACVDNWLDPTGKYTLGGTCLNVGCIPSKALLDISHQFEHLQSLDEVGINVGESTADIPAVIARKAAVVEQLTGGVGHLFSGNGVEHIQGTGALNGDANVRVTDKDGNEQILEAKHVVLAPGSIPISIPGTEIDGEKIVDSEGALAFTSVPQRLGIIGAGIIGLELGSVWRRFGSNVVILEALEEFLPAADNRIARDAKRILTKQGLEIRMGTRVTSSTVNADGEVEVNYLEKDEEKQLVCDRLIVAVGRQPNTENVVDPDSGVSLDERGFIEVNEQCLTEQVNVYAVGDAVRGPMLAHKGMEEGIMVAERITGKRPQVNYDCIPSVIYTHPEIAWVGPSEQALKADGEAIRVGSFSFGANGRAIAANDTSGIVKLIADEATDELLAMHVIGPQASELIAQGVIALEMGATAEDLGLTMFAHPSLSEAVHESALGVAGKAIHTVNRRSR